VSLVNDVLTEIWVTGTNETATYTGWQDISSKILVRDDSGELKISRGATSETSNRVSTSSLTGQINNRSGNFSDQNPTGIYYGLIGRNTKIRTSKRYAYDAFGRTSSNGWGTADSGEAWSTNGGVAGDYSVSGGTANISNGSVNVIRETYFDPTGSGLLDGTISATVKPGVVATGQSIYMALQMRRADANNCLFAVATFDTTSTVTLLIYARVAGVNTIIGSTADSLAYGASDSFRLEFSVTGGQYVVRLWNTASPDTQIWTYADDSTTAGAAITAAGNVGCRSLLVTGNTNVTPTTKFDDLVVQDVRFTGEIPDLPQEFDITNTDRWVPFTASGRFRRLQQGSKRLQSVMTRAALAASPLELWPLEDASGSTQATNAVAGGAQMTVNGTAPSFGTAMMAGTASGLTLGSDTGLRGAVRASSATVFSTQFMINVPAAPASAARVIAVEMTGGTYPLWLITIFPSGGVDTWGLEIIDNTGVRQVFDAVSFNVNGIDEPYGQNIFCTLEMRQNGGNVEYEFYSSLDGVAFTTNTGSYAGTLGTPNYVVLPSAGQVGIGSGMKYSQVGVWPRASSLASWAAAGSYNPSLGLNGYIGEDPVARMIRLCDENGIDFIQEGDSVTRGTTMGPQAVDTLYNVLHECVDVDQGVLYEPRAMFGFVYRAAASLYNQTPVTLDYNSAHLSGDFKPKTDDLYIWNDVTVARKGGSSVRVIQTSGRLSTSEPPAGVGTYDRGTFTVNCRYDSDIAQLANWLLALGTLDEPRYPAVTVELHRSEISVALGQQVIGLDSGDYFTITNPPSNLPQFTIECLVLGYEETLSKFRQTVTFRTRPGAPWRVIKLDSSTGNEARAEFYGQTLNGAHTSSTTTLSIATASPWPTITTAAGDYPMDIEIAGERITLNGAPAGSTSPQSFTGVTRSVNGVVKAQLSGRTVQLWRPNTLAY
jgi:hypothetical protein